MLSGNQAGQPQGFAKTNNLVKIDVLKISCKHTERSSLLGDDVSIAVLSRTRPPTARGGLAGNGVESSRLMPTWRYFCEMRRRNHVVPLMEGGAVAPLARNVCGLMVVICWLLLFGPRGKLRRKTSCALSGEEECVALQGYLTYGSISRRVPCFTITRYLERLPATEGRQASPPTCTSSCWVHLVPTRCTAEHTLYLAACVPSMAGYCIAVLPGPSTM